jgi:hypothetical protein
MVVEAAMRHARRRHQIGDADALEAALAKQFRSGGDDPIPVLGRFLFCDAQGDEAPLD